MFYEKFIAFESQVGNQLYALCPFHVEDTPSFTVNEDTGEWFCHACQLGGTEKEFIKYYFDVSPKIAEYVYQQWLTTGVIIFPSAERIDALHQALLHNSNELDQMLKWGISKEIIERYQIGFDTKEKRVTIPIKSKTEQFVNIRKYLPTHHRKEGVKQAKCLNIAHLGQNRFFPYEAFNQSDIYIVEGEKDCLVARSQGINAVTSIGGSNIPTHELNLFKDKNVFLMLDTDDIGIQNTLKYQKILQPLVRSLITIKLPEKDFTDYWMHNRDTNVLQYTSEEFANLEGNITEIVNTSLTHSEFIEHFGAQINLPNISIVGAEPQIYTIPIKFRVTCTDFKCNQSCELAYCDKNTDIVTLDARHLLQFIDTSDTAQVKFLQSKYGCKKFTFEPIEYVNVQKIIFQESASFVDGLEESSFENRLGVFLYNDYRLQATCKYNLLANRVSHPKTQQNYYVVTSAENIASLSYYINESSLEYFREVSEKCPNVLDLFQHHYNEWIGVLGIEGRLDLFATILLAYCSVTEIPWQGANLKGWLDVMCIGDTRTGKSQMVQRFVKYLKIGSYINGENARRTGVIGGVQQYGSSWIITWGAIPMNDKGLLIIDEASGLEVDDIKDLSSTRSSGSVTINKIVKGEARARTRLIWLSNPRSGKNVSEFYWKGFDAFKEFIPVAEDQARFDLVCTAAREDIDILDGIDDIVEPDIDKWLDLIRIAWNILPENISYDKAFKVKIREESRRLNDKYGGGPLYVGVAAHEKLLRMSCAMAILRGDIYENTLKLQVKHVQDSSIFLEYLLNKESLSYVPYIQEYKRAKNKRDDNVKYIRGLLTMYPALQSLLSTNSFKGFQFGEVLGIDKNDSSKILSDLITRGLIRATNNASYKPDKLLMDIARQVSTYE